LDSAKRFHVLTDAQSVESLSKMTTYLKTFKERIEKRDKLKFDIPLDLRAAADVARQGGRGSNLEEENQYQ
jgi:hypothetical protein